MRSDHAEQLRELDAEILAVTAALICADTEIAEARARRDLHAIAARVSAGIDRLQRRNAAIDARTLQIVREAAERRHNQRPRG